MMNKKNKAEFIKKIGKETDWKKLDDWMEDAKAQDNKAVYQATLRRKCVLMKCNPDDPLCRRFLEILTAHEQCLRKKHNGKRQRAGYTRRMLKDKGVDYCLMKWATDKKPSSGFEMLVKNNLHDMPAEYLVIKYASRFKDEKFRGKNVIEAAWDRFEKADLTKKVKALLAKEKKDNG